MKTRSLREIYEAGTPNSFSLFALFFPIHDPLTFEEAIEEEVWAQAMDEEIECIEKNQTWELVDVPKDKDVISVKWIYKTKQDADGNVQKNKARMVAIGSHSNSASNSMKRLHLFHAWIQSEQFWPLLHKTNGNFIRWMSSQHS